MHGFWAAIGPTAGRRNLIPSGPAEIQRATFNGATIERWSPPGQPLPAWQGASHSGRTRVYLDGELSMRDLSAARGLGTHITAFAEAVDSVGVDGALEKLKGGSFVAAVFDSEDRVSLLRDPLGTIPAYEARVDSDWIISTNPVSLARCEGVDTSPDRTALAGLALAGYSIGTRYFVRGIRTLRTGDSYLRSSIGAISSRPLPLNPFHQLPAAGSGPSAEEVAAAFTTACAEMAAADIPTAHMQSGGLDSRMILAAWPKNSSITCFGYGDAESGEVSIAHEIAQIRGVQYHHFQPDGRQVAEFLPSVYDSSGLMVYPARWFLAKRMEMEGYQRVLDGFAGGFLLGGCFTTLRRTHLRPLDALLARHRDEPIQKFGLARLAEQIFTEICELPKPGSLAGYISEDYIEELEKAREPLIADIHEELVRLRPLNDSLALLVRNFTVANRSSHAVIQQAVISRCALSVGFPYTADSDFLKLALSIPPERSAYRKLQIEVVRHHFPEYGKPRYGVSMLPAKRSAAAHQLSTALMARNIRVPGLSGPPTRSPNNWAQWLHDSAELRDLMASGLRSGGIASKALPDRLQELGEGTRNGMGKLLHLATVGRWLNI